MRWTVLTRTRSSCSSSGHGGSDKVPDARRCWTSSFPIPAACSSAPSPRMTEATAQRIVDTITSNGGRVGSGDTFVHGAGLADDDVFDLYHTALTRLDPIVAGQAVGVLLPLRLETRFRRPNNGGQWMPPRPRLSRPGCARAAGSHAHPRGGRPGRGLLDPGRRRPLERRGRGCVPLAGGLRGGRARRVPPAHGGRRARGRRVRRAGGLSRPGNPHRHLQRCAPGEP